MALRIPFIICLLVGFASCRKEVKFPVRIVNQTDYDFPQVSFFGTVSGESITLNANDTSEILIASYQKRVRLTPKLLRLILSLNEQQDTFNVIRNAPTFPFSKQILNEDLNTIIISKEIIGDTLIFHSALE